MDRRALRNLPSVDDVLNQLPDLKAKGGHVPAVKLVRAVLDQIRRAYQSGAAVPSIDEIAALVKTEMARTSEEIRMTPVINATGVVIHTNLGRSILSEDARQLLLVSASEYTDVEYDLQSGQRGKRGAACERLLTELTGAESALVVNNCAAATVLMLSAVAGNKSVIVSRGELVEIGGGFRIPDIMTTSGAQLIEVGTTNRTHLHDYAQALQNHPDVAAILQVHPSNFRIIGFTESVSVRELSELTRETNDVGTRSDDVALLVDLGSGALVDTAQFGLAHEPTAQETIAAGADMVTFSGDKLLGGPQAGIMVGKRHLIERCRVHPLARAFRVDKFTLAALSATLAHYLHEAAAQQVPTLRMLSLSLSEIRQRAEKCLTAIADWSAERSIEVELVEGQSAVGGGSLPGQTMPTVLIALKSDNANDLLARLRHAPVPVIGRIKDGRVLLDLRTVTNDEQLINSIISIQMN